MKNPDLVRVPARGAPIRRLLVLVALAVPLAGGPFQDARAGCRAVAQPLKEALQARDLDAALHHYDAVNSEFACPDEFRARAKRAVSNLHAQVAMERLDGGASLASQRDLLERGREYAGTWLTLSLLGDIAHAARDYVRAATLYQGALRAINDEVETPQPPPNPDIERIYRLAAQSRMLAGRYVAAPTNRAGEPDGLAAPAIRGFQPRKTPVPITFRTGEAEFDESGREFAEELAQFLKQGQSERIILSAHTDERGTDAYNLELSRQRGEAVRRFLQTRGVAQPIRMIAKGESQPLDVFDLEHYGQEEVWRMNRRVEWIR